MLERVRILLDNAEYSAILKLADRELRGVSDQARHIVRRELERLGYLETTPATPEAVPCPGE